MVSALNKVRPYSVYKYEKKVALSYEFKLKAGN